MVIRFILPLLLAFGLVGQVVQPDPKALVPVQCAIVAVDPFGVPLSSIEVKINGVAQKIADSRVSLPQGRHTIEVSARGFAPISQAIDVTGSTQKLVFCLRVGSLFDRSPNPVSIALEGAPNALEICKDLLILPLHCAMNRRPIAHQFFKGHLGIEDLEPGSYVMAVLSGTQSCALARVSVGHQLNQPITIKVTAPEITK